MKKKTILSFALALALMVSAIGTATSAFAATSAPMEPVTKIATEKEDTIWEQIEAIEEKSDAIFQRNTALWETLDEICNALPDDYDFTNFDEAAFYPQHQRSDGSGEGNASGRHQGAERAGRPNGGAV